MGILPIPILVPLSPPTEALVRQTRPTTRREITYLCEDLRKHTNRAHRTVCWFFFDEADNFWLITASEECRETTHEGVSQTTEVSGITNFFRENVARIVDPRNVAHVQCTILDPFPNRVFRQFNPTHGLRGHVVRPLHAGRVIVV